MSTISDKDRPVGMIEDGEWYPWTIMDADGAIKLSVTPSEGPGRYALQIQVRGRYLIQPDSRLEVRVQRYPIDPKDGGTAWHPIMLKDPVEPGVWFDTFHAIVEIKATGTYSRSIGIDYRVRGGRMICGSRVLKFEKLP